MLQKIWQAQVGWHEPIPAEIQSEWHTYKTNLSKLNELIIPRQITIKEEICDIQIHGFADASERAYGCSLYLRCSNNHFSNLICAKSKVAPIKTMSLPRLELCAALLLSRIAHRVIPKMKLNLSRKYYWTDSMVTLCWINSTLKTWKTFVAHRIGQIQEKTLLTEWFHVRGNENPADIISRGCCPTKLAQCDLWWHGPDWLRKDEEYWPVTNRGDMAKTLFEIPEQKNMSVSVLTISDEYHIVNKYSSIRKLSRVIAYCLRFRKNCLQPKQRLDGVLLPIEINYAKTVIIKMVQKNVFSRELQQLQVNQQVSPKSKLYRLRPFLDDNGVIRVGGRLKYAASISVFQKHPAVLPTTGLGSFVHRNFNTRRAYKAHAQWTSSCLVFHT